MILAWVCGSASATVREPPAHAPACLFAGLAHAAEPRGVGLAVSSFHSIHSPLLADPRHEVDRYGFVVVENVFVVHRFTSASGEDARLEALRTSAIKRLARPVSMFLLIVARPRAVAHRARAEVGEHRVLVEHDVESWR